MGRVDESDWLCTRADSGDVLERVECEAEGECGGLAQRIKRQGNAGHELALVRLLPCLQAEKLTRKQVPCLCEPGTPQGRRVL